MNFKSLFQISALAGLAFLSSCSKDDDGSTNAGSLDAGKATTSFNASGSFGNYNGNNQLLSSASRQASTGYEQITITTSEMNGTNVKTAQLAIEVPLNASTANGNITGDFSLPNGATILPVMAISTSNAGQNAEAYGSETGTLIITKLTDSEVEGTFSGKFINGTNNTSVDVTNGKFAGRFR